MAQCFAGIALKEWKLSAHKLRRRKIPSLCRRQKKLHQKCLNPAPSHRTHPPPAHHNRGHIGKHIPKWHPWNNSPPPQIWALYSNVLVMTETLLLCMGKKKFDVLIAWYTSICDRIKTFVMEIAIYNKHSTPVPTRKLNEKPPHSQAQKQWATTYPPNGWHRCTCPTGLSPIPSWINVVLTEHRHDGPIGLFLCSSPLYVLTPTPQTWLATSAQTSRKTITINQLKVHLCNTQCFEHVINGITRWQTKKNSEHKSQYNIIMRLKQKKTKKNPANKNIVRVLRPLGGNKANYGK